MLRGKNAWGLWLDRLYNLRRDKQGDHERPHKPALLLAILDLLDRGLISENAIELSPELKKTFARYFEVVRKKDDQPSIENPYYHLCGDGVWMLFNRSNKQPVYEPGNASRPPSAGVLRSVYGQFDEGLWDGVLSHPRSRHQLRNALIARYFPDEREKMGAILSTKPSSFEPAALREDLPGRDGAFRKTILEIYDYRCAACGIRVKLSSDLSMVEAAHIIPFSQSGNDRPDNGLALCPNHHWAMDRFLIAPCPDPKYPAGVWKVGERLDERVDDQKELLELENKKVLGPSEQKFNPAFASLKWREDQLKVRY
jgi:putative restriction endonuclease